MASIRQDYREICAYVAMVLGALGLVGNALCAKVMRIGYLKGSSTCVLLFGAVLSDTVILVIDLLDSMADLIPSMTAGDLLYGQSDWRCRLTTFVYDTARVVSSWLTVAMSVELCLVRSDPKRRPAIANTKRAVYVALAILLVAIAACFPFLVIARATPNKTCSSKYMLFFDTYSDIVLGIAVDSLVPIFFIIVCTMKSVLSMLDGTLGGSSSPTSPEPPDPSPLTHPGGGGGSGGGPPVDDDPTGLTFSYAVIATCGVFLITVTPTAALETINAIQKHYPSLSLPRDAVGLAYAVTRLLFLLNHSAKLYVWFITEEDFRSAWRQLYMCGHMPMASASSSADGPASAYNDSSMDMSLANGAAGGRRPPNYSSTREERL